MANTVALQASVPSSNLGSSTNGIKAHKDVQPSDGGRHGFESQIFHKKCRVGRVGFLRGSHKAQTTVQICYSVPKKKIKKD